MIDIRSHKLIALSKAARSCPPSGRSVHPHTLYRWHKYGRRGIRLECVMIGGKLYTTEDALFDFLELTNRRREEADNRFLSDIAAPSGKDERKPAPPNNKAKS